MLHPIIPNVFVAGEQTKLSLCRWFCIVYYRRLRCHAVPLVARVQHEGALMSLDRQLLRLHVEPSHVEARLFVGVDRILIKLFNKSE